MTIRSHLASIAIAVLAFATAAAAAAAEGGPPLHLNEAIAKLDALARAAVAEGDAPGIAVAVVQDDRLVHAAGFGLRNVDEAAPVDADTVFQLASLSKPIASTVVAELVGEGQIAWTSRISDLDPVFQLADPWISREVTLADLFSHRSGLPDHAGDLLEDLGYDQAEVLHRMRWERPAGAFRVSYAYTNFGLTEAAEAAARPYGLSFEDAAASRLFRPLGMTSASYRFSEFIARADRARPHVRDHGRWTVGAQRQPDAEAPAGGASASVRDLAQWMRLQLADGVFAGRRLISRDALEQTRSPQIRTGTNHITGGPTFYGLGWNVGYDDAGRLTLTHSGAFAMGASTAVYLVPAEHLGIVVLVNAAPEGVPESLTYAFIDEALRGVQSRDWSALFRKVFADPIALGVFPGADWSKGPASPRAPAPASGYIGTYANQYFGPARVRASPAGGLVLELGPGLQAYPLTPFDGDSFTFVTTGENAVGKTGVTFEIGPDRRAARLTIDYLDVQADGVFTRAKTP